MQRNYLNIFCSFASCESISFLPCILHVKIPQFGVPIVGQQKWIWLVSMGTQVRSLASLNGLRILHWHELVQACDYSFDLTPSLGTSICCGCSPGKKKKVSSFILLQPWSWAGAKATGQLYYPEIFWSESSWGTKF